MEHKITQLVSVLFYWLQCHIKLLRMKYKGQMGASIDKHAPKDE